MDETVKLEQLKIEIRSSIRYARESLGYRCCNLAQHLTHLADKLKGNTPHDHLCVNDLGEIQSQGTIIDAECGGLMSKIDILRLIQEAIKRS